MDNARKIISMIDGALSRAGSALTVVIDAIFAAFDFVRRTLTGKIIAGLVALLLFANVAPDLAQQVAQGIGVGLAIIIALPIIIFLAFIWWLVDRFWN